MTVLDDCKTAKTDQRWREEQRLEDERRTRSLWLALALVIRLSPARAVVLVLAVAKDLVLDVLVPVLVLEEVRVKLEDVCGRADR